MRCARTASAARAFELLSYPTHRHRRISRGIWPAFGDLDPKIAEQLEIDAKYAVYLDRQAADIASYRRDEGLELPEDIDYAALAGLSNEVRQKLKTPSGRAPSARPAASTASRRRR